MLLKSYVRSQSEYAKTMPKHDSDMLMILNTNVFSVNYILEYPSSIVLILPFTPEIIMAQHVTANITGDKYEFDPERWTTTNPRLPKRQPETGIDVLIAGAGIGGLITALECWRKGHNIIGILEQKDGPVYSGLYHTGMMRLMANISSGDIMVMQPSGMSIMRHWPDMWQDLEEEQVNAIVNFEMHTGKHIYGPTNPSFNDPEHLIDRKGPFVAPAQIRRKFFRMLLRQVAKLGFKVEYGKRVCEYFEDKTKRKGGVILQSGETYLADIVVAADGLGSPSESLITGQRTRTPTKSSGMSIYRAAFPTELAFKNETIRKRWGDSPAAWEYWLGPGMYIGVFISPETVGWGFTLLDPKGVAIESWEPDTDPEDVVKELLRVPDWHPAITALIRATPKGVVVHSPLLWRDLRREWISPNGHVVQVGDSAHNVSRNLFKWKIP